MKPFASPILIATVCLVGCSQQPPAASQSTTATSPSAAGPAISASQPARAKIELREANWEETVQAVAAHKGKIVVLDTWSLSCGPCVREFPGLVKMHQKLADRGVVCLSLNCDYDGIPKKPPEYFRPRVTKFLEEQGATFENLISNVPLEQLLETIDLASIPAVFVYGRDGKLVKRFDNEQITSDDEEFTYADVNRLVAELLAKSPQDQ
jgi:thiol-disulfide isomerase/thioredoxin